MRVKCNDDACIKNEGGECKAQIIHLEMMDIEEDLTKNAELKCKDYNLWEEANK